MAMTLERLKAMYYRGWAVAARAVLGKRKFEVKQEDLRQESRTQRMLEKLSLGLKERNEPRITRHYMEAMQDCGLSPRELNTIIEHFNQAGTGKQVKPLDEILGRLNGEAQEKALWHAGAVKAFREVVCEGDEKALKSRLERIKFVNARRRYKGRAPIKLK